MFMLVGIFINDVFSQKKLLGIKDFQEPHGDLKLKLEFMVPRGSNSGVYLQGRYEIQILDSLNKIDIDNSTGLKLQKCIN